MTAASVKARETPLALSTFDRPTFRVVSRNKTQLALSTLDPRIERLESLRAAKEISHSALCSVARVHPSTWFYLRSGDQAPRGKTLDRLERGLAALIGEQPRPANLIAAFVRAAEAIVLMQVAGDRRLMRELTPDRLRRGKHRQLPKAIEAGRLARIGIYLAAVEFEVGNAELARALGVTRQAVHKTRNAIEDLRERPSVDALLERCRALLKGEAA